MVFHMKKHNLTVTVTHRNRLEPIVRLALGSEVRILKLAEFTNCLLSMIEDGRKATTAYMAGLVGGIVSKVEGAKGRCAFAHIQVEPIGLRPHIGATLPTFKCPVGWSRGFEIFQPKRLQGEHF